MFIHTLVFCLFQVTETSSWYTCLTIGYVLNLLKEKGILKQDMEVVQWADGAPHIQL